MRVSRKWWFLMVALPIIGLCVKAGFWQLDRATEKHALIDRLRVGGAVLTSASQLVSVDPRQRAYRVDLEVTTDPSQLVFVDNRIQTGRAGYEVFGPVRVTAGTALWVNFGWVEAPARRNQLPSVAIPNTLRLRGRWVPVTASYTMTEAAPEVMDQATRVQSLAGQIPQDVFPGMVIAEGVVDRDALGPMPRLGPATHYGYAVQWFLMATVLSGLTGWVAVRGLRA
jgi:cytochrome oxidase assembly protein ShyY1